MTPLQLSEVIFLVIGATFMAVLTLIHSVKVYQDLFTAKRKSIIHRKTAPRIDRMYKWQQYLILCALLTITLLTAGLTITLFVTTTEQFFMLMVITGVFFAVAKMCQYSVFLLKLHHIYRDSQYKSSEKMLWTIGGIGCLGALYPPGVFIMEYILDPANAVREDENGDFFLDLNMLFVIPYRLYIYGRCGAASATFLHRFY